MVFRKMIAQKSDNMSMSFRFSKSFIEMMLRRNSCSISLVVQLPKRIYNTFGGDFKSRLFSLKSASLVTMQNWCRTAMPILRRQEQLKAQSIEHAYGLGRVSDL